MKASKRSKVITLAAVLIGSAAAGLYFYGGESTPVRPPAPASPAPGPTAAAPTKAAESNTPALTAPAPIQAAAADASEARAVADSLILIPGGTFSMGSPDGERQRQRDEVLHEVTISPFYADPYEVTQRDYEAVMGTNPSHFRGADLPVEGVTWYDAIAYCNRLSELRGLTPVYTIDGMDVAWDRSADGYRLLTEAEWEYAARAGTSTVFFNTNHITSSDANFEGSYPYLIEENYVNPHNPDVRTSMNRGETIAVGSLAPNAFGLYNMYGNVSEWCFDYYGEYSPSGTADPAGPASGSLRVNRGGGWNDFAKQLRSAYRSATTPDTTEQNLGFRIARNAAPGEGIVSTAYSLRITLPDNPRVLVAYFSYSGNTEKGARLIADRLGCDLFEIEMTQPYRGNIYEVSQQDLNNDFYPPLTGRVADMDQYDAVILGYPTWWSTMPMPVFTFLSEYDFSGKVILPFSSNGGTRFGDSVSDLSKMVPGAYVAQPFEYFYSGGGSLAEHLYAWLAENGISV